MGSSSTLLVRASEVGSITSGACPIILYRNTYANTNSSIVYTIELFVKLVLKFSQRQSFSNVVLRCPYFHFIQRLVLVPR